MNVKIKKESLKSLIMFLVVICMIMLSKTVYFGIINRSIYQYVFWIFGIAGLLIIGIKKNKLKENILKLLPFLFFLLLNLFYYYQQMDASSVNELLGIILNFLVVSVISSYLGKNKFATYYIKIMAFICIISLACVLIANVSQDLAFSLCQPGYDWKSAYGYSWFYTWGWNGVIFLRNSGPFWEPGAFQGFIIFAIMMLLYNVDDGGIKSVNKKWYLLIFIVTIITTQSTTGYILLIILILTQLNNVKKMFQEIPRALRTIIITILSIIVILIIISSNNISTKFAGTSNDSALIRYSDVINGIAMWNKNPLLGLGLTAQRDLLKESLRVSVNDSAGISFMIYTYGIPFTIYYVFRMIKGFLRFFKARKVQLIVLTIVFVILNITEGIWWLPVYLYILFV